MLMIRLRITTKMSSIDLSLGTIKELASRCISQLPLTKKERDHERKKERKKERYSKQFYDRTTVLTTVRP